MVTAIASCGRPSTMHLPLPPGAPAARHARQNVARMLALEPAVCPRAVAEDLLLIVSELVTNAVLHAHGPYALTVSLGPGRAGIAVTDGSGDMKARSPDAGTRRIGPGGRGLKIVRALGADLFVSRSDRGKQVVAVLTWQAQ
ncbi:ATP-binding protein [Streptomyces sp. NPDC090112]|uniref:ATP-binding protein n=1 Tax=Streptomyces sp. NPDC090112 TaxID=3365949 RepID=UPI00381CC88F